MKVEIEKLPESKIRLKIEVPPEKVDEYIERAYAEISKTLKLPGFRSGHIPHKVIDEKIGTRAVHEEAIRLLIPFAYVEAISQEKILAVGKPEIKVTKFAPGNPAEFDAETPVVPEIKLGDYKKIKVEEQEVKVRKKDVEKVLQNLQKKEAKLSPKQGKTEKGDWVEIDFEGSKNGIILEKLKSKNHPVLIGDNALLPDFEKEIIGISAGEEKEFDLKFPEDYNEKDLADEKIHFKVKILKIQKVELPEINDEFIKRISGGTDKKLEDLKKDIKTALIKQREYEENLRREGEVIKQVTEQAEVEIPRVLIDDEVEQIKKDLVNKLESQGLQFSRYLEHLGKTEGELKEGFKEEAERRIKVSLVLSKIAETENIKVSDEEAENEIKKTEEEATKHRDQGIKKSKIESEEAKSYIKVILRNKKTIKKLLEYAKTK